MEDDDWEEEGGSRRKTWNMMIWKTRWGQPSPDRIGQTDDTYQNNEYVNPNATVNYRNAVVNNTEVRCHSNSVEVS